MRPITSFTLHAMLAAALAALAASAAAGPVGGELFIRLPPGESSAGKGGRLEIQSFQWLDPDIEPVQSRYYEEWSVEIEGGGGEGQAAPAGHGSLRVRARAPWPRCRVGARYPELELMEGGRRYRLRDVTVSSCGGGAGRPADSITFAYAKLG